VSTQNARSDLHQADGSAISPEHLAADRTIATIVAVAMPLIETDTLTQRMKAGCNGTRKHPRARL